MALFWEFGFKPMLRADPVIIAEKHPERPSHNQLSCRQFDVRGLAVIWAGLIPHRRYANPCDKRRKCGPEFCLLLAAKYLVAPATKTALNEWKSVHFWECELGDERRLTSRPSASSNRSPPLHQ